jgi:membrane protease YdiL (CAAX protease family)
MINSIKNTYSLFLEIGIFLALFVLSFGGTILKSLITKEPLVDESDLEYLQPWKIFTIILLTPFIEEFFFRGFFNFEKGKNYFVLSAIVILFMITIIANKKVSFILALTVVLLMIALLLNKQWYNIMTNFISEHLIILAIISSICFGFIHLSNYEGFKAYNLLVILPKILGGFFYAYIAIRYNIWVALLYHSVNNIIPFLIIYLKVLIR